jgi:hypothetical protein
MFSFNYDGAQCVLVAIATAGPKSDADFEQLIAQIDALDRRGKAQNKPVAFILFVDPGSPTPGAQWRRRFAEQRRAMVAPRVFIAVVVSSAVARGVLIAVNWIAPDPPHVQSENHSTFDGASRFIERAQGTPASVLRRIYEETRASIPKAAKDAG